MNRTLLALAVVCAAATAAAAFAADAEPAARCDGRPDFSAGEGRGYWVWRDGDRWSVRWTTYGAERFFTGSVGAEGGDLKGLDRVDVERESRVVRGGRPPRTRVGPRGRVHVRPGRAPVVATREEDKIEKDGDDRIVWSSRTTADVDGFNFEVGRHVTRLHFVLRLDGKSRALDVALGRNAVTPHGNPFEVVIQE